MVLLGVILLASAVSFAGRTVPECRVSPRLQAGSPEPVLDLAWIYEADPLYSLIGSGLEVAEGLVAFSSYHDTDTCRLHLLNASTGELLWAVNYTAQGSPAKPVIVDGVVYVHSMGSWVSGHNSSLLAFNALTGVLLWNFTMKGSEQFGFSSPLVHNGVVYLGHESFRVYAVNASTGVEIWQFSTITCAHTPLIMGGVLYISTYSWLYSGSGGNTTSWRDNSSVYAVDAQTGTELWSQVLPSIQPYSSAVVPDALYIGSNDAILYALNTSMGDQLWNITFAHVPKYTWETAITILPIVAPDWLYLNMVNGSFFAVNQSVPQITWHANKLNFSAYSPPVTWYTDRLIGVSISTNATFTYPLHPSDILGTSLTVVNSSTGEVIDGYDLGRMQWMQTGGISVYEDAIFVLANRTLYVFGIDIFPPRWIYAPPTIQLDEGTICSIDLQAEDLHGLDTWWLQDAPLFTITPTGHLESLLPLTFGTYPVVVAVNDTLGNTNRKTILVHVKDITPPTWTILPENQYIFTNATFTYPLYASDASGITQWQINTTDFFAITPEGILYNSTRLRPGIYAIRITVTDTYGNTITADIQIHVEDPPSPSILNLGFLLIGAIVLAATLSGVSIALILRYRSPTALRVLLRFYHKYGPVHGKM